MTDIRIADFDPAHTEELVRMWRASFEFSLGVTDPHPLDEQIAYLRNELLPQYRVRIAWRDDRIAGFLAATTESIAQLYVRVDEVGHGIGTRLLDLAKAESSGRLWLFTHPRNTRACQFYERRGFVVVARGYDAMWQLPDVKLNGSGRTRPSSVQP